MKTFRSAALLVMAGAALLVAASARAQQITCISPIGCTLKATSDTAPQYLTVRVTQGAGIPARNVKVKFEMVKGAGRFNEEVTADDNGFATTVWRPASASDFPAEFRVSARAGSEDMVRTLTLSHARSTSLALRAPGKDMGNDQWWYENRQLRDSLTVVIEGAATEEECRRASVAFRPVGGGVAAPDTAFGRWRAADSWDCVATTWWRLPQGIGTHYLRATLTGEPSKSVAFKGNARALPRINVGVAWSRRSSFTEVQGVDTIEIRREFPDQNTVVVKDSVISEVKDIDGNWVLTPTIGVDFPLLRQFAGLRFSASTSLTDPDENLFLGVSGFQPFFGTGQEALGVDLHVGVHVQRQSTLANPGDCRADQSQCDTERRYRYGLSFMGLVDGVSLLGNLISIFGG